LIYRRGKINLCEKAICYLVYPATSIVTIFLPFLLQGKLFSLLDNYVFTLRLTMAKYYLENNKISLFGVRLNNPYQFPYSIDMAGMYLILQLGIVAFIIVSIFNIWFVKKTLKKNWIFELVVYVSVCLAGLWEPFLYNASYKNLIFIFWGALLFNNDISEEYHSKDNNSCDNGKVYNAFACSAVGAVIMTVIFLMFTRPYTSIYADVESSNIGQENVQQEIYLSPEDEQNILENNGIILRWWHVGEPNAPVYQYDSKVAINEYRLKVFSVFVYSFILILVIKSIYIFKGLVER
jgi:hypothetical protein